jgi:predicted metal-dependent peptidase
MDKRISASLLTLRRKHPFLATLSLFMSYKFSEEVSQFSTDGKTTLINPGYFARLTNDQCVGTLLHVTLHCALLHATRCGLRWPPIWNIAADIVVNEIILESRFSPPPNTAVEPRYAGLSVEQVYAKLIASGKSLMKNAPSSIQGALTGQNKPDCSNASHATTAEQHSGQHSEQRPEQQPEQQYTPLLQAIYPAVPDVSSREQDQPNTKMQQTKIDNHWKRALTNAQTVDRLSLKLQGDIPLGLLREIDQVLNPQLDWRSLLWRFIARTPCDYAGFDRRFIHQGLYLDQLESESLKVYIAMDTSGSIETRELAQFRAEINSILRCYAFIEAELYFVDAAVYGPYPNDHEMRDTGVPGGGGTDFSAFFNTLAPNVNAMQPSLCVYLTDGFGQFPERTPELPVLWVISSEGTDDMPFGEVVQLGDDYVSTTA